MIIGRLVNLRILIASICCYCMFNLCNGEELSKDDIEKLNSMIRNEQLSKYKKQIGNLDQRSATADKNDLNYYDASANNRLTTRLIDKKITSLNRWSNTGLPYSVLYFKAATDAKKIPMQQSTAEYAPSEDKYFQMLLDAFKKGTEYVQNQSKGKNTTRHQNYFLPQLYSSYGWKKNR